MQNESVTEINNKNFAGNNVPNNNTSEHSNKALTTSSTVNDLAN